MFWIQDIYKYLKSFFNFLSFRTKPDYEEIESNYEEYEFIILNEKMTR